MRRSQKDLMYLVGTVLFSLMCFSDLQHMWKMLLFLLAFAGLNLYNYIKHKRNEEKWDDILDDMEDDDDRRKKKKTDKDKFNDYMKHIEEQFGYDDEDEEEYEEDE